jgi:3,4-dihydroxy 2-butanone 4-phosphate synthase/GTP cyclohydrolase II
MKEAIRALKQGKMIILTDDEHRENEGDFVVAAEKITPEHINFMASQGRGLICLSMTPQEARRLAISPMVNINESLFGTAFGVTIEAASGITTGSSTFDRAHTIRTAVNPKSGPNDIVKPGHVFPLIAKEGGVLTRRGHTEGSVDLMRQAGLGPQAVLCEIMKKNGKMAQLPDLRKLAKHHQFPLLSIAEIAFYRTKHDPFLRLSAKAVLPTQWGKFDIYIFTGPENTKEHTVLVSQKKNTKNPLVRIHSSCLTGDILGSLRCDCGFQLGQSLSQISQTGGALIYLSQEGRGIGLANKIKAYALQEKYQLDTVEANHRLGFQPDQRDYLDAAQILHYLGMTKIQLLTNNPQKIQDMQLSDIQIIKRIPLIADSNAYNQAYLETKQKKLGHLLEIGQSR